MALKRCLAIGLLMVILSTASCANRFPRIVAHRGASHDAPENTLASFRLGFEQKADAIEGDFWLTADGQIVCIHDKDTKRVTGGAVEKLIAHSTLAELQELDVGTWKSPAFAGQTMPTLADVLEILPPDRLFLIEIKCGPEIVPALKRVIEQSGKPISQLRVIAFDAEVIRAVKQQIPAMKAFWLTSYRKDKAGVRSPTPSRVLATLERVGADGLDTKADLEVLTPAFVRSLREMGYELHVWTVDDPLAAQKLAELGVDSITTNRPAYLREHLRGKR